MKLLLLRAGSLGLRALNAACALGLLALLGLALLGLLRLLGPLAGPALLGLLLLGLLRAAARAATFGAAGFLGRRLIERRLGRSLARKVLGALGTLEQLLGALGAPPGGPGPGAGPAARVRAPAPVDVLLLVGTLKSLEANFARLSLDARRSTARQRAFRESLCRLVGLLKASPVRGAPAEPGPSEAEPRDASLFVLLEAYEALQRRLPGMSLRPEAAAALRAALADLRARCDRIARPRACWLPGLWAFAFESALGTLDQMRAELELHFPARSLALRVAPGAELDALLLLPTVEGEKPGARDRRLRGFELLLEEREEASHSRDGSLPHSRAGLGRGGLGDDSGLQVEAVSLAVLCQPNSQPFEMSFYEQSLLRFFLDRGFHVCLWNYRGYGRSSGKPSLQNVAADAQALVRWLKLRLPLRLLVVHGRSLGGHAAKAVSHLCDLVVLDRTFSSVSLVAGYALRPAAQWLFDLFLDNHDLNCRALLETDARKVVLYDPKNDHVVRYFASLTFGLTAEFANLFFNRSHRADLEATHTGSEFARLFRRCKNPSRQRDFHRKQLLQLRHYKLLLNERDAKVLFFALRRIVRACFARAEDDRTHAARQHSHPPDFDLERLASEGAEEELLDEETLANVHQAQAQGERRLEDPSFDYSALVHTQVDKESCFKAIDKIFTALSFIEAAGLTLPEVFLFRPEQQEPAFHSLILGLVLWGSNLPLSALVRSEKDPFDASQPLKLAAAKFEECLKLLGAQRAALEELRKEVFNVSTFYQCLLEDLQLVSSRLKLLAGATGQMRRAFRELRGLEQKSDLNESRDSFAETGASGGGGNALFTRAGSEGDFYEARRKFLLVPLDVGHNQKMKADAFALLGRALDSLDPAPRSSLDRSAAFHGA